MDVLSSRLEARKDVPLGTAGLREAGSPMSWGHCQLELEHIPDDLRTFQNTSRHQLWLMARAHRVI